MRLYLRGLYLLKGAIGEIQVQLVRRLPAREPNNAELDCIFGTANIASLLSFIVATVFVEESRWQWRGTKGENYE
jgi:hypothetical protein